MPQDQHILEIPLVGGVTGEDPRSWAGGGAQTGVTTGGKCWPAPPGPRENEDPVNWAGLGDHTLLVAPWGELAVTVAPTLAAC